MKIVDNLMLSVADKSNALDQQTAAKDTAETHSFDDGGVVGATSSEDLVRGGPDRIAINSDVSDSAGVSVLPSAGTRLSRFLVNFAHSYSFGNLAVSLL